ncbi:eukaryotic aspartyl protease, partial [Opisthorchis viverrini]
MMFDTGASGISLPGDIHMAMNEILGIKKQLNRAYVFDCEKLSSLPPVEFQIQRKTFKIMPKQYTKQTIIDGVATCATNFYNITANSLVGIVLGMSFLHSFQLIFDDQMSRVGFAARAGSTLDLFRRFPEALDELERDKRTMFQIPLYPWGDSQYICKISIEQTEFRMLLDTGSPSIWVPSDRLDKRQWRGKSLLHISQTTSLKVSEELFDELYGIGGVSGKKATADINFGGTLLRNVFVDLVMDGAEKIFANPFDGIIGLGRRSMSPEQTQPLHYTVSQQGRMSQKFGFPFQEQWFILDGIFIFKTGFNVENHRRIFDTGTPEIHLPGDIHMAISEVLGIRRQVDRVYVFECGRLPFLPPVTFQMEGKMFQIMPKQYTSLTTTNGDITCRTLFYNTSADCPVGLTMGMSFLHSFQMIFDDNAGKVGFAARSDKSFIFEAKITIAQTVFQMLLDTGSPSIWVPSDRVNRSLWVGKNLLNSARETSLQVSEEEFYEKYGSGGVYGMKATVHMKIGGMLIRNVPFGLVVEGEREIYENTFDGVIGLGRRSMCLEQTQPLIQSIHQQGLISRKFGFHFQNLNASFFMGDNLEPFPSDGITYINVADGPYWETRINWIFICKLGLHTQNHRMIFDTGARAIHLPGDIHMAINDMLKMKTLVDGEHVFDCEMLHFLPPIAFQIQGKMFQIFPKQYTIQ